MTRKKRGNIEKRKKELTAGSVKDELAKKWRKSGSLGKKEKISKRNASVTMRAAKEAIKENPNASKKEIARKTQEKLQGRKKLKYLPRKEKINKTVDGFVKNWKKQGKVKKKPKKEAVERTRNFTKEAYKELRKKKGHTRIPEKELKEKVNKKIKEWKKKNK
ncbi:MAG: hypothetical protein ACOCTT_02380 [archaeon]